MALVVTSTIHAVLSGKQIARKSGYASHSPGVPMRYWELRNNPRSIARYVSTACSQIFSAIEWSPSAVVVEQKLVRVRPQTHFVDLARALVVEVSLHQVLGEDVAFEKELMIVLERVERLLERSGSRGNVGALLWR